MAAPTQIKVAEQIRDDILASIAADTGISDQNLGSNTRSTAYAVGSEIDEVYFQLWRLQRAFYIRTATGTALDSRGADYGLTRRAAQYAIGTARFTFTGAGTHTVPNGALVSAPATTARDKIQFATPATGTYNRTGAGTIDVPITAVVAGAEGNLGSGTITQLDTTISGVTAVTNPSATTLGAPEETDDEFRARILRHIEGLSRCTVASILNGAIDFEQQTLTLAEAIDASATTIKVREDLTEIPLSIAATGKLGLNGNAEVVTYTGINTSSDPHQITGVTRAQEGTTAVAHEEGIAITEYIPTGEAVRVTSATAVETTAHVNVWIDDGTATGPDNELVDLVEKRLRGDGTERDPGYKAGGVTLDVYAVSIVSVNVVASVIVASGYNASDVVGASGTVNTAVTNFLNSLVVGQDVIGYQVACVITDLPGVETINSLSINGTAFDGTNAADVAISSSQAARSGSHTIT